MSNIITFKSFIDENDTFNVDNKQKQGGKVVGVSVVVYRFTVMHYACLIRISVRF